MCFVKESAILATRFAQNAGSVCLLFYQWRAFRHGYIGDTESASLAASYSPFPNAGSILISAATMKPGIVERRIQRKKWE